ncbi:hypothetical protein HYALB_00005695 [Hymenoscyphus albidus]|uniref:VOC domain-containing protein n=1 Tax=Hymenoscyphus albidus TaxID=595503 RepID=A0A9N9LH61_9HELO|nr:hypothetical protein HYALB_00005695 [Hymenoscyphus albidus]
MASPVMRVTCKTHSLTSIEKFYVDGLGLKKFCPVQRIDDRDGLTLCLPHGRWQLVFTRKHSGDAETFEPPNDFLYLTFYEPDKGTWEGVVERMEKSGYVPMDNVNDSWQKGELRVEDPDGWHILFHNEDWPMADAIERDV